MNATCKATTNAGERCRAVAVKDGLCALHADPRFAAEMGRKSGQARRLRRSGEEPQLELQSRRTAEEVRTALGQFISDVSERLGALESDEQQGVCPVSVTQLGGECDGTD